MEQVRAFRALITYVSIMTDKKITTDLQKDISEICGISVQTVQNFGGKRQIRFDEACKIANHLKELTVSCKKFNSIILYEMIKDFLESVESDRMITDSYMEHYKSLINTEKKKSDVPHPIQKTETAPPKVITNHFLDESRIVFKRKDTYKKIRNYLRNNRVIYLLGSDGSGKTPFMEWLMRNVQEDKHKLIPHFFFNGKDLEIGDVLSQIIYSFSSQNTGTLSLQEKEDLVSGYFRKSGNTLIIIDDVNEADTNSFNRFISFFSNVANYAILILTSNKKEKKKIKILEDHKLSYGCVKMPFTLEYNEWENLAMRVAESNNDVRYAIDIDRSLIKWIYEIKSKEPSTLQKILIHVSRRIHNGSDPFLIKKNYSQRDNTLIFDGLETEEVFCGLSENAQKVLVALSLFSYSPTIGEIYELTHIPALDEYDGGPADDSELSNAIEECNDYLLLNVQWNQEKQKNICAISFDMKEYINNRINSENNFFTSIVLSFAQYCISYTNDLYMCVENFELLKKLDPNELNDNLNVTIIKQVLQLCEKRQLWEVFYKLSLNTCYYFYHRGISGSGKNSIHYRRAMAGKKISRPDYEYEALLYFCNISCKTKESEGVQEAFDRLVELHNDHDIPIIMRSKYRYVKGLYYFSQNNFEEANVMFDSYLDMVGQDDILKILHNDKNFYYDYLTAKRWKSDCLCCLAENGYVSPDEYLEQIEDLAHEVETGSEKNLIVRAIVHSMLVRGRIYALIAEKQEELMETMKKLESYKMIVTADSYYHMQYKKIKNIIAERSENT